MLCHIALNHQIGYFRATKIEREQPYLADRAMQGHTDNHFCPQDRFEQHCQMKLHYKCRRASGALEDAMQFVLPYSDKKICSLLIKVLFQFILGMVLPWGRTKQCHLSMCFAVFFIGLSGTVCSQNREDCGESRRDVECVRKKLLENEMPRQIGKTRYWKMKLEMMREKCRE